MGCHTWFHKKITPQPSYEEIKQFGVDYFQKEIDLSQKLIDRTLSADLLEAYPEWTPAYGEYCKEINLRKQRLVSKGLCKLATYHLYNPGDNLVIYIDGKGHYEEVDEFHDLFRIGGYPEDILCSLQETLEYIESYKIKHSLTNYQVDTTRLENFWGKYPDGVIRFG